MGDEGKTAEEQAEEVAAEAAEAAKAAEGGGEETKTQEDKTEVKTETKPSEVSEETVQKVMEKMLSISNNKGLTPEQQEQQVKALETESGLSRKSLGFIGKAVNDEVTRQTVGLHEERGVFKAEKTLGNLSGKLLDKVKEEMKKQPISVRANPEAWENMAYLIKGKHMGDSKPDDDKTDEPENKDGGKVKGLTKGGGTSGSGKGSKKTYSEDEQRMINMYFSGDAEAYEKRKSDKTVSSQKEEKGTSAADRELERLTGGVR